MPAQRTDRSGLLLAAIVVFAAALRIPGLASDFWLDEIWTLKYVYGMHSAWDVFTSIHHSNNHHLNTLILYALGDLDSWWPYRIHSLLAGVGSVALAFRIGARRGRSEGAVAGLLCATSYLLIHYSSEARGYSLVVFFALASFDVLEVFLEKRRWTQALLFQACACLGFLSHLMYLHAFLAAGVFAAFVLWRRERSVLRVLWEGARAFAAPTLFLLVFYWFDIRLTKIGEGPELDAAEVFVRALSYAIGGPPRGAVALAVAIATVVLFAGSIAWWARKRRDAWVFLAVVVFVSPAATFALMRPQVFFVRYFLLATAFGLVALAGPVAAALRAGGVGRAAAGALLAATFVGNGIDTARFYRYGRGDLLGTVRYIADRAGDRLPTVGGDHRFRTNTVIRFYNRYLPPDRRLVYRPQQEYPDWLLLHRIGPLGHVDPALVDGQGHAYVLARVARYSDLSGWHWLLYRKVDDSDTKPQAATDGPGE